LSISVKSSSTVDVDILSSELEERRDVLEDEWEGIRLPVIGIVGEQNISLDI